MSKLTDMQLIILAAAAARDDGFAVLPEKMNKAAALKVGSSLVARKLMREVRGKYDQPVWRTDAGNRAFSLVISREGRKVIGIEEFASDRLTQTSDVENLGASVTMVARMPGALRENSKGASVVKMLSAPSGATLDAIVEATGWLPHTTRAALTGLRKRGFDIQRTKEEGAPGVYRISTSVNPDFSTKAEADKGDAAENRAAKSKARRQAGARKAA